MRHTSWPRILVIGTVMLLMLCRPIFPQEIGGQVEKRSVGRIVRVSGTIYWKSGENEKEVEIKARDAKSRPLYPGESLRCGPNCRLMITLYGKNIPISEQMGWFPIPSATDRPRDSKTRTEETNGATGGRISGNIYNELHRIPDGQPVKKFRGIVVKRDADWFTVSETTGGQQTVVLLTPSTEVKSHKKGAFRGSRQYEASYILRGLRLEVDGVGNAEGQLAADKIRFDEQDLRMAQALRTTDDPVESELRDKLRQQQAEQERLAGQLNETNAVVEANRMEAKANFEKSQAAAAEAQRTADYANNRINGLDDFDPIKTITVTFRTGSAALTPAAKQSIDEAAAWVKTQNTKGWVLPVVGYADSTGNSARNRDLSERRAQAVIYYIVTKYKLPMHRFVQPFGYGQLEPVADNRTSAGRAKNRRVEIRLMVNKGITSSPPN
jgi:OOP family OmpA-OmpF porin